MKHWPSISLIVALLGLTRAEAQETVIDFLQRETEWAEVIKTAEPITLSGRFEGRVADRFRLARLPIRMLPLRTARLPRSLDAGQRLLVTGILRKEGSRYTMNVSGIAIGKTDEARYQARFERLPENAFADGYLLAQEANTLAEFYKDRQLQALVATVRDTVFERQRNAAKTIADFRQLSEDGTHIGVSPSVLQSVNFQAIVALGKQKPRPTEKIIQRLKSIGAGWDQPTSLSPAEEQQFESNPVQLYTSLPEKKRASLHRYVYRNLLVPDILKQEKPDSSNADKVADTLVSQFPELAQQGEALRQRHLNYRLQQVRKLSRQQIDGVITDLNKSSRQADVSTVVDTWLAEQERLRNTGGVAGRLTTADQYLYAAQRWKQSGHQERGVKLLKQVWEELNRNEGVEEATNIEQRLESLGWVRLRDRWLTSEQVRNLPPDDVDLAMKQRRIVVGMTARQVLSLGEPSQRTRIYSASSVREVWVYDEGGSSALIVHLSRSVGTAPEDAIAIRVGKSR